MSNDPKRAWLLAGRSTLGDEASNFKKHPESWQKLASPSLLAIAKKTTVRDYAENSDVDAEVEGWQLETDKQFSRRFFCDLGIYNANVVAVGGSHGTPNHGNQVQ